MLVTVLCMYHAEEEVSMEPHFLNFDLTFIFGSPALGQAVFG